MTEFEDQMMEIAARDPQTHCRYCGRELVDVEERDTLYDPATGERPLVVWRQCPRWPRNGWVYLFLRCRPHESFQRDRPWFAREYR